MSTDGPLAQRADALLTTMTLEEKAGQLSQYFYMGGWTAQNELVEAQLRAGQTGRLLFVADPRETNRLQRIAVEQSRLGIPLLFGFDVIHGDVDRRAHRPGRRPDAHGGCFQHACQRRSQRSGGCGRSRRGRSRQRHRRPRTPRDRTGRGRALGGVATE